MGWALLHELPVIIMSRGFQTWAEATIWHTGKLRPRRWSNLSSMMKPLSKVFFPTDTLLEAETGASGSWGDLGCSWPLLQHEGWWRLRLVTQNSNRHLAHKCSWVLLLAKMSQATVFGNGEENEGGSVESFYLFIYFAKLTYFFFLDDISSSFHRPSKTNRLNRYF